jgi:hypothetical protein
MVSMKWGASKEGGVVPLRVLVCVAALCVSLVFTRTPFLFWSLRQFLEVLV